MDFNSAELILMYGAMLCARDMCANELESLTTVDTDREFVLNNNKNINSVIRKIKKVIDDNGIELPTV